MGDSCWCPRELHVITESGSGILARRGAELITPISVWHADERTLWPAVPEPFVPGAPAPAKHLMLRELIVAGGADPIAENGVLAGEVRGPEVCRVVDDPVSGRAASRGRHRCPRPGSVRTDARRRHHRRVAPARRFTIVEEHRRWEAPPHPFNRLARERLLRWQLVSEPSTIGAVMLDPVAPPVPRPNLKDLFPCVAAGRDAAGAPRRGGLLGRRRPRPDPIRGRRPAGGGGRWVYVTARLVVVTPARDQCEGDRAAGRPVASALRAGHPRIASINVMQHSVNRLGALPTSSESSRRA